MQELVEQLREDLAETMGKLDAQRVSALLLSEQQPGMHANLNADFHIMSYQHLPWL